MGLLAELVNLLRQSSFMAYPLHGDVEHHRGYAALSPHPPNSNIAPVRKQLIDTCALASGLLWAHSDRQSGANREDVRKGGYAVIELISCHAHTSRFSSAITKFVRISSAFLVVVLATVLSAIYSHSHAQEWRERLSEMPKLELTPEVSRNLRSSVFTQILDPLSLKFLDDLELDIITINQFSFNNLCPTVEVNNPSSLLNIDIDANDKIIRAISVVWAPLAVVYPTEVVFEVYFDDAVESYTDQITNANAFPGPSAYMISILTTSGDYAIEKFLLVNHTYDFFAEDLTDNSADVWQNQNSQIRHARYWLAASVLNMSASFGRIDWDTGEYYIVGDYDLRALERSFRDSSLGPRRIQFTIDPRVPEPYPPGWTYRLPRATLNIDFEPRTVRGCEDAYPSVRRSVELAEVPRSDWYDAPREDQPADPDPSVEEDHSSWWSFNCTCQNDVTRYTCSDVVIRACVPGPVPTELNLTAACGWGATLFPHPNQVTCVPEAIGEQVEDGPCTATLGIVFLESDEANCTEPE